MNTALVAKPEVVEGQLAPMPFSPEYLIATAIDKGLPLETLEKLLLMRDKLKSERAREAFYEALSAFQSECPVVEKKQSVLQGGKERYRYASLGDIVRVVGPLLHKHRLSYRLEANLEHPARLDKMQLRLMVDAHMAAKDMEEAEKLRDELVAKIFDAMPKAGSGQTYMHAVCSVHHADGHSESSEFRVPVANDNFMTAIQHHGSARTYACRYAFCDAFGIMTGDEDDDANTPPPEPARPAAPSRQTAPPPAPMKPAADPNLPASGTELAARLAAYDAKLAAAGTCKPGELLAHVSQQGVTVCGYPADLAKWHGAAIPFAVDTVKAFVALRSQPQPAAPPARTDGLALHNWCRDQGKQLHAEQGCTSEGDLLAELADHGKAKGWGADLTKWHGEQLRDGEAWASNWLREKWDVVRQREEYEPVEGEVVTV